MSMFEAMNTAYTGTEATQAWMTAISNNLANMNDVVPGDKAAYRAEYVDVAENAGTGAYGIGTGVSVTGVTLSSADGTLEHDPSSALADAQGDVRVPDVDMAQQMTDLIMAQRGYEANLNTISDAESAYKAALGLTL